MKYLFLTWKIKIGILTIGILCLVLLKNNLDKHKNRTHPPENVNSLKQEIFESLVNPFQEVDTVILETTWGLCGNTPNHLQPIILNLDLEKPINIEKLSTKFNQVVIPLDTFHNIIDAFWKSKYENQYIPNIWDTLTKNIVHMVILAEKINSDKVKTTEIYSFGENYISFSKTFTFKDKKWTYITQKK